MNPFFQAIASSTTSSVQRRYELLLVYQNDENSNQGNSCNFKRLSDALVPQAVLRSHPNYLGSRPRLRSRTPGPPPFSSLNSMPAFSRAVLILSAVFGRPASLAHQTDSNRAMVGSEIDEYCAKSPCDQPSKARAALICRVVSSSSLRSIDSFSIDSWVPIN